MLLEEARGHCPLLAPRNLLCSAAATSSLPRRPICHRCVIRKRTPSPPATGCSKLLFLWETIKEMLPSVQNLNCLMHGLCSGVAAVPPRDRPFRSLPGTQEGATTVSTPSHSLCTCNFKADLYKTLPGLIPVHLPHLLSLRSTAGSHIISQRKCWPCFPSYHR